MSPSRFEICLELCAELLTRLLLEILDFFAVPAPLVPPAALSLALHLRAGLFLGCPLGSAGSGLPPFSDMVLGDSEESKSFDCTLAENRTVSSSAFADPADNFGGAFPEETQEAYDSRAFREDPFREDPESMGTSPAGTWPGSWLVEAAAERILREMGGTLVGVEEWGTGALADSSLPKDFASSRR